MSEKTKAFIKRQLYQEEVNAWMDKHASHASDKFATQVHNRKQYQKLIRSLRFDRNPRQAAAILLDPIRSQDKLPENEVEEALAGALVENTVRKETRSKPLKSMMSPAVVLTEQRRNIILESLMTGGLPDDSRLLSNDIVLKDMIENSPDKNSASSITREVVQKHSLNSLTEKPAPLESPFKPRWQDYNTMKTRWNYILPQTKKLSGDRSAKLVAPTTSTNFIPINGLLLHGNYLDIHHTEKRLQSPGLKSTLHNSALRFKQADEFHFDK